MDYQLESHLRKGPIVVMGDAINHIDIRAGNTGNWSIPTITNSTINVARVEAFKVFVQHRIAL